MIRIIFPEADTPSALLGRRVEFSDKNGPHCRQGEKLRIKAKGTEYTFLVLEVTHVCSTQKRKHTEVAVKLVEGQ